MNTAPALTTARASRMPALSDRRRLLVDIIIVTASITAIAVMVKLAWPGFTYWGDNANSFFPLWHMYGTSIRGGESFLFDHNGWAAANVIAESAYGLFNPLTALNAIAVSYFDNLARASFLVMTEFMALLGIGTYMLTRVYGASRSPSVIAAVIVPFSGYTLFWEAGNWASGLMSITWVVHFWWAARAYSTGRMGPIPAVLLGGAAATVGNPYAVLGILIVLFGLALELLIQRDLRRLWGLVAAGACVGAIVLFVYLPLLNVLTQVDRPYGSTFANGNYLSPSLGDLVGLSSPSYLPRMDTWTGNGDLVPSTYLSWLILGVLPWLKWRAAGSWRSRISLVSTTVIFLLFTLGPDTVWLFRWPIRLIEYSYVGAAVLFALLLSSGLARDHVRRRLMLTGFSVIVAFFVAWSSTPALWPRHLLSAALVAGLCAVAFITYRRFSTRGLVAVVIAGTAMFAPLQASWYGWNFQMVGPDVDLSIPTNLSVVQGASSEFEGDVLQIADIMDLEGTRAVLEGRINFGNTAAAAGVRSMNRYTGLNFREYQVGLNMDYRGSVGRSFELERLFTRVSPNFDATLLDAMGVDTLVVSTTRLDFNELDRLDSGWRTVERSPDRTVLVRNEPKPDVAVSGGLEVDVTSVIDRGDNAVAFRYSAGDDGGTVLVDRLAWRGYSAVSEGTKLPIETGPFGLLEITVPSGSGTVTVDYEVPGFPQAIILLALGLVGASIHQIMWRLSWRSRTRSWAPEVTNAEELESNYMI